MSPLESGVVAVVLNVDELQEQLVALDRVALFEVDHHPLVIGRRPQAVNARDASDDDDVLTAHECGRGGQAQAVDIVVDERVFFDVDVALRNVRFRLVIVVIADEIMHRIMRQKRLELLVKLSRQRLVVRQHQRRLADASDDVRGRERLARAGDAEQRLAILPGFETGDDLLDRLRLIAGGDVRGASTWKGSGHVIIVGVGRATLKTTNKVRNQNPWRARSAMRYFVFDGGDIRRIYPVQSRNR